MQLAIIYNRTLIYLITISLLLFFNTSYAFQNKILFKVDNEIITSIDILNEIEYRKLLNINLNKLTKENLFEIAKKTLVREKIKKIEISKYFDDTILQKKQIDQILEEFVDKSHLQSIEELEDFLEFKGIKLNTFIEKIKIEILWNQLIVSKFSDKIKVDKNEIKKNVLKKSIQKSYLLYEIVFNLENESLDQKYNKIKKEIYEKGFENTASNFSISDSSRVGGKLGWIKFNSLSDTIKTEIKKLSINDFSKPIVIPGGFLILKVENEKDERFEGNIDNEVENISKIKANKQLNQFSNIYLNKIKKDILINEL